MSSSPSAPPDSSAPRPIFAIFEGGGAKAVAHLGAYAAAADMQLDFVGVAGASAGSIVATLIAVGFTPDDIFDPDPRGRDLFAKYDITPVAILGAQEWRLFVRLRRYARRVLDAAIVALVLTLVFALLRLPDEMLICALLSAAIAAFLGFWALRLLRRRGIFDPANFAAIFNRILRDRVAEAYTHAGQNPADLPEWIRFRDIDPRVIKRFCRLKVVVTDVSGQQLKLFDHRTPDVAVAEAVAASIAIPGIFKPARIPSAAPAVVPSDAPEFADGGLVSNLPVWCFSEEKAAMERRTPNNAPVPIVAFTLSDLGYGASAPSALAYFRRVLRTGIFGGQTVAQEFVADLYPIPLRSGLSMLDFDAGRSAARWEFDTARRQASQQLRDRLELIPRDWQNALAEICDEVSAKVDAHLATRGRALEVKWRAAMFEPVRPLRGSPSADALSYRITHSLHMETDCDDRLTLDAACPGVPEAFDERSVSLWDPEGGSLRTPWMTKYERALLRRSIRSVICVPIFEREDAWEGDAASRNPPLGVLSFDTDEVIIADIQDAPALVAAIAEATIGLSALLTDRSWRVDE